MLDELVLTRFNQLIDVRIAERSKQFPVDLAQIDRHAAAQGAFHSSSRLLQLHQAHERELEVRAIIAWESLVRVHKTLGCPLSETLREDLKSEIARVIQATHKELSDTLQERLQKTQVKVELSLNDAYSRTTRKHEVEIDLYVDSLGITQTTEGKHPMTQNYNFYGNVGAVQTGANAVANVIQNLGAEDRAALSSAIKQVRDALGGEASLSPQQRQELLEIADECSAQLGASSPNNTRLLSMFNVLGTAIQSIASAQPAYQALKVALLPLGITLP